MTQAIPKLITFDDFLEWKPENGCYELHNTERVQSVVFPELNLTAKQILNAGEKLNYAQLFID